MWRNPKYPSPAEPPRVAPVETGRRLASLPRRSRDRPDEALHVTLDSYEGHPYISVRLWARDGADVWFPTKRGVSVRMGEAQAVADAIMQALHLADGERGSPPTQSKPASRRGRPAPRDERGELPDPSVCLASFDDGA